MQASEGVWHTQGARNSKQKGKQLRAVQERPAVVATFLVGVCNVQDVLVDMCCEMSVEIPRCTPQSDKLRGMSNQCIRMQVRLHCWLSFLPTTERALSQEALKTKPMGQLWVNTLMAQER